VTVPEGWAVELLVVDNGSTDHTHAVVNEARLSNMSLRHVSEPVTGLSNARNRGLRETSREIILFTDDDVRVPWNWIEGMCRPILDGAADAVAGGVVFPAEQSAILSRPALSSRRGWFASSEELNPKRPARMVGVNMAFHRRVLGRVPKFDVELGAGALGFGEESLFSLQLLAAGFEIVGALDIVVEHYFDLSRLTSETLADSARKMGRSHAFLFHHWEHKRSRLVVPRLLLCHLRRYWTQCFDQNRNGTADSISDQFLNLERELAFYREYIVQSRRGFKYTSRGIASQVPEAKA
jgi:glycosyltransferase involved in cell wall biosynthesis